MTGASVRIIKDHRSGASAFHALLLDVGAGHGLMDIPMRDDGTQDQQEHPT
jgi:hypothetical protein